MKQPVFRFAPSPNGYLHLGHALSALIDFEMARTLGGRFLLRIEESTLKGEVLAAGFRLAAEGQFLRHPEDTREERIFGSKTPVDEFVLKFEKPN